MDEIDPRLVRLLTRHLNDLRGYATALSGVVMAAPAAAYLATRNEVVAAVAFAAAIAAVWVPMKRVNHYYRSHLGRVVLGDRRYYIAIGFGIVGAISSSVPFGMRGFWVVMSLYPGWLLIDGWPYRKHMILETTVALVAAMAAGGRPVTASALAPWFLLFGLAAIVSGLADHALLLRVTRATREGSGALAHERD
jgi:hypothetical protein